MGYLLKKIISGGQTGTDRAALDIALELGIPCGGWCPRGRRAEDGVIPESYPLTETSGDAYPERTELNVRDADATLIITRGRPSGGTAYTIDMARKWKKPYCVVDLDQSPDVTYAREWLQDNAIRVLNVAGPRESSCPGVFNASRAFLELLVQGPNS